MEHLEWALAGWLRATRPHDDREPIALDGKTLRGAGGEAQPAPHLLPIYTHQTQEVFVQVRVADKANEIPAAQALLPLLCGPGRVVTADALHTQTAFVATARAHGSHVVLIVKANQPMLFANIVALFADPLTTTQTAQMLDRHHGRREQRRLRVSTDLTAFLRRHSPWPAIGQVGELTRSVTTAPRARPAHAASYDWRATIGTLRTACTTSAMSPLAKITRGSVRGRPHRSWPPAAISPSRCCDAQASALSPLPAAPWPTNQNEPSRCSSHLLSLPKQNSQALGGSPGQSHLQAGSER